MSPSDVVRILRHFSLLLLTTFLSKFEDRVASRIKASFRESGQKFRLEQLCKATGLTRFEKFVILSLLKGMIMPSMAHDEFNPRGARDLFRASVSSLIDDFCCTLEEKMNHRSFFYRSSSLIREGIVRLNESDFMQDLTTCSVDLDRRMFDFVGKQKTTLITASLIQTPTFAAGSDALLLQSRTGHRNCRDCRRISHVPPDGQFGRRCPT